MTAHWRLACSHGPSLEHHAALRERRWWGTSATYWSPHSNRSPRYNTNHPTSTTCMMQECCAMHWTPIKALCVSCFSLTYIRKYHKNSSRLMKKRRVDENVKNMQALLSRYLLKKVCISTSSRSALLWNHNLRVTAGIDNNGKPHSQQYWKYSIKNTTERH